MSKDKEVVLITGAGQISLAIARRIGHGKKLIIGDKSLENAVLLEEVGKVIDDNGVGVTISSQSGFRMPQLTAQEDFQLVQTPT